MVNLYYLTNEGRSSVVLDFYGIAFPHGRGEFCARKTAKYYTVCCFETPFVYEYDGGLHSGNVGDILIVEPGRIVYHGPAKGMASGFVNDWFHIIGDDFRQLLERYPLPLNKSFSVGKPYAFRSCALQIENEFGSNKPGSHEMITAVLTQLIIQLHRDYVAYTRGGLYQDAMEYIHSMIHQNPGRKWTLLEMSQISGYSVSHFSHLYSSRFGVSPVDDLIDQRIQLAKQLLSSGQTTVTRTAELCGFQSINYFSKCFKQRTGVSPVKFINKLASACDAALAAEQE